jgi:hypothetical protein
MVCLYDFARRWQGRNAGQRCSRRRRPRRACRRRPTNPHSPVRPGPRSQDCDCSPVAPLVACGLVTGDVFVHRYGPKEEEVVVVGGGGGGDGGGAARQQRGASSSGAGMAAARVLHRRGKGGASARAVRFTADGSGVVCGYESGSIQLLDLESGKLAARLPRAHTAGISRLLALDGGSGDGGGAGRIMVAAGDEDGALKVRQACRPRVVGGREQQRRQRHGPPCAPPPQATAWPAARRPPAMGTAGSSGEARAPPP